MSSTTVFPAFKPIDLACQNDINKLVHKFPPYSDFNFVSLFSWNTEDKMMVSILNGNLVVLFDDYITKRPFLSFLGDNKIDETIYTLVDYCEQNSIQSKLSLVPEIVVNKIHNTDSFNIEEDRDAFDYIVDSKQLLELNGKHYSGKRHGVNKFLRVYSKDLSVKHITISVSTIREIIDTFEEWNKTSKESREGSRNELTAVKRLLQNSGNLSLETLGFYIKSKMIAFSIYEILPENYSIGHFEKAINGYPGIYDYMKHVTASSLFDLGVKYINYEQDLGIEGLRRTKMLLHPAFFLKKYTITSK